jgi:hypothetical protein
MITIWVPIWTNFQCWFISIHGFKTTKKCIFVYRIINKHLTNAIWKRHFSNVFNKLLQARFGIYAILVQIVLLGEIEGGCQAVKEMAEIEG